MGSLIASFIIAFYVLAIVSSILVIWALIHCAMNKRLDDNTRLIGILLIIFLGPIGCLIYLFLPRKVSASGSRRSPSRSRRAGTSSAARSAPGRRGSMTATNTVTDRGRPPTARIRRRRA